MTQGVFRDFQRMMEQIIRSMQGGAQGGFYGDHQRVALDEKYFRRIDQFEGDVMKYKGWRFDVLVAIGQIDRKLAEELGLLVKNGLIDKWDPSYDKGLTPNTGQKLHDKYKGELFGVLCSLTLGEAKAVVKSILDKGEGQDGFKAFVDLNHRYDLQTAASLLGSFLEVVNPPGSRVCMI